MKKETFKSTGNYEIPCITDLSKQDKLAVIISHGFGSSKTSQTATAIAQALRENGIGSCRFDWPTHGDSQAEASFFRIQQCLSDLRTVEAQVKLQHPDLHIAYFSSSFGAYLNLHYLAELANTQPKKRYSFLRAAAVDMAGIFAREMSAEDFMLLSEQGYLLLEEGYAKPIVLKPEFLSDLQQWDVFQKYHTDLHDLCMIHGTADETAPFEDAKRFAAMSQAKLIAVADADHSFTKPDDTARVIAEAIAYFQAIATDSCGIEHSNR